VSRKTREGESVKELLLREEEKVAEEAGASGEARVL